MRILLLLTVLLGAGCSFLDRKDDNQLGQDWTVEKLYDEAKKAMDSGYYSRAVEYYEVMETRFPFGVYGQQSLLDLAFVYFKLEKYEEALSTCDRFIRLYPQNERVDYAYYLRGLVNFNKGKSFTDRFLPIDLAQRDNTDALQAFKDFSDLAERFPESPYIDDTRKRMTYLRNLLAEHEVNVATYYMRRGAFVAAANRARYVVENYDRTTAVPDALVIMAKSYKIMEMDELSDDALRVLEMNFPNHAGIAEVRKTRVR
jgi:outer membrane protein assembly factor BamD